MNTKEDKVNRRALQKHMKEIDSNHGTLLNQQLSLESYVEKYLPLKMQHQMSETIMDCLDKKAKTRFIELNSVMASALRDDIIKDSGHPKLRAKCLDIISKLRIETSILNPAKTGRRPESPPKPVKPVL